MSLEFGVGSKIDKMELVRTPRAPRRLLVPEYSFDNKEAARCANEWGMNCGPSALATMLKLHPDDVRSHIPNFEHRKYTNPTMMKSALASLGVRFHEALPQEVCRVYNESGGVKTEDFPSYGLARIQFEGPWLNPGVPIQARYRNTHWVGSMVWKSTLQLYIFDVNGGWLEYPRWRDNIMPALAATYKRATGGWYCTHRLQLELEILDQH